MKANLFTDEMRRDFTCHPKACPPCYYNEGEFLDDVYRSYSADKARAYRYCRELCDKYDGFGFRITGHNCNMFSVGFDFEANGRTYRAHITKAYNHLYVL